MLKTISKNKNNYINQSINNDFLYDDNININDYDNNINDNVNNYEEIKIGGDYNEIEIEEETNIIKKNKSDYNKNNLIMSLLNNEIESPFNLLNCINILNKEKIMEMLYNDKKIINNDILTKIEITKGEKIEKHTCILCHEVETYDKDKICAPCRIIHFLFIKKNKISLYDKSDFINNYLSKFYSLLNEKKYNQCCESKQIKQIENDKKYKTTNSKNNNNFNIKEEIMETKLIKDFNEKIKNIENKIKKIEDNLQKQRSKQENNNKNNIEDLIEKEIKKYLLQLLNKIKSDIDMSMKDIKSINIKEKTINTEIKAKQEVKQEIKDLNTNIETNKNIQQESQESQEKQENRKENIEIIKSTEKNIENKEDEENKDKTRNIIKETISESGIKYIKKFTKGGKITKVMICKYKGENNEICNKLARKKGYCRFHYSKLFKSTTPS